MALVFAVFSIAACSAQSEKSAVKEQSGGPELKWYTDVNEAQAASVASNKPIFAFFTGSDWCGWCKKLQREVFAKPAFKEWAAQKVVLLELDFPRGKQQDDKLRQQNQELQQAFQVRGYPTIWIFTLAPNEQTQQMMINAYGSLGYPRGAESGKEEVKFLSDAEEVMANKPN